MTLFHRLNSCHRIALIAIGLLLTACTTTTTQSFKVVKETEVEFSSVAVDADFGKYDRLFAADMGIHFPTDGAPSLDDQKRTRQIFRDAFIAQLAGYEVSQEKGPTTLEVQATIIDYRKANNVSFPNIRRELRDLARPGALLFLMEMKDSASGKLLARAGDSAMAPAFSTSEDAKTDWDTVTAAAEHWAMLFRKFLDANLNRQ
jgi:hypothetical protein